MPSLRRSAGPSRSSSITAPRPSEVGDTNVFTDIDIATELVYDIPATVRATVTGGGLPYTLAVWVADESWSDAASTCDQVHCVTQPMVDAIAGKFLQAGADNDVYDWVTAVFGAPWGDHDFPGFLISPDTDEIHILLFDIARDESTTGGLPAFSLAWTSLSVILTYPSLSPTRSCCSTSIRCCWRRRMTQSGTSPIRGRARWSQYWLMSSSI